MNAPETSVVEVAAASIALAPGEEYAGIAFKDGKPSHHLVVLPGDVSTNWKAAGEWTKEIGGELPTRAEQALLYGNRPDLFKKDWYWSSEQRGAAYAWSQIFSHGDQNWYYVSNKFRARTVRRIAIS